MEGLLELGFGAGGIMEGWKEWWTEELVLNSVNVEQQIVKSCCKWCACSGVTGSGGNGN